MPPPDSSDSSLDWKSFGLAFSHRLRLLRQHRKLSQEKLGEMAGLHRNQISNLERNVNNDQGAGDPQLSTVYKLARALGVAPVILLPDRDQLVGERSREVAELSWHDVVVEINLAVERYHSEPERQGSPHP